MHGHMNVKLNGKIQVKAKTQWVVILLSLTDSCIYKSSDLNMKS